MCSTAAAVLQKDALHIERGSTEMERLATDVSTDSEETIRNPQPKMPMAGLASSLAAFLLVAAMSVFVLEFSLWFPFVIPGVASAAKVTYEFAWFEYDPVHTKFDNTPWTYNTDYLLTAVMSVLAVRCLACRAPDGCASKDRASLRLRLYSASLLVCYGISTLAGAWAHQHFTSVEDLNTPRFRVFWFLCMGNVSFASCYMGLIGREVQKVFGVKGAIPLGPWWFWPAYGSYMALTCGLGYISFKRPACDIFIAGITQFPTTFYCLGALGLRRWPSRKSKKDAPEASSPINLVRLPYRIMYYVGFIGNSPLLPLYPVLVQHSGMSLAGINTLLHSWLMVMWGLQGISLIHLCTAMSSYKTKEP
ncbi:hypothetical protein ACHAWF_018991 [Thalassiosira exigua]